jgi:hypothetical protein
MSWNIFVWHSRAFLSVAVVFVLAVAGFMLGTTGQNVEASAGISKGGVEAGGGTTFPANAGTLGAIPDRGAVGCGPPAGPNRDVTFTVSGLGGAPTSVSIDMTVTHTWVGDVNASLIAPNGATHVIFSRTGATTATSCGDSSDLGGLYNFTDTAAGVNWWQAAATAGIGDPIPLGNYRTTQAGPQATTNNSPATDMSAAFTGVADPNGTWILRLNDVGGGDTGSISAANLTIAAAGGPSGPANVDIDGDGFTDWVVLRDLGTPAFGERSSTTAINRGVYTFRERQELDRTTPLPEGGSAGIAWFMKSNQTGAESGTVFGNPISDFATPADFDGDGKTDIAVWRPGAPDVAAFHILQSSDLTVRTELFGQNGDNPTTVGDYDGDGKADPAVYRCPPFPTTGQCFFFFRGSSNNPGGAITYVPWGSGTTGDFFINNGDFDGDGKHDFCIQRANPLDASKGQFVLLRSSDGGVEFINWGLSSDFILPGDYDGDGKSDFMVRRTQGGQRQHYLLTRTGGGTGAAWIPWGIVGDVSVPGDYDGDGKQDLAIWRPNADPAQNFFWVLRSSDGAVVMMEWGMQGDYPAANWYVN